MLWYIVQVKIKNGIYSCIQNISTPTFASTSLSKHQILYNHADFLYFFLLLFVWFSEKEVWSYSWVLVSWIHMLLSFLWNILNKFSPDLCSVWVGSNVECLLQVVICFEAKVFCFLALVPALWNDKRNTFSVLKPHSFYDSICLKIICK